SLWAVALSACVSSPSGPRPPVRASSAVVQPVAARHVQANSLRLATFNIQVFGPKKASDDRIMVELVAILRRYDLVAVQEIKDVSGEAPRRLLERLNKQAANDNGVRYGLALSPRTGREPDDR